MRKLRKCYQSLSYLSEYLQDGDEYKQVVSEQSSRQVHLGGFNSSCNIFDSNHDSCLRNLTEVLLTLR